MISASFVGKIGEKFRFELKDCSPALANCVRRIIVDTVPTMAIEDVDFNDNSSALYDEMLALRLGLIPLSTDIKGYNERSKCKCGGEDCNSCTLKLHLKAKGPGVVYAKEMKSKDPKVKPVYSDMPIVKLLKDQELDFEATAVLDRGSVHAKFSPGLAWFTYARTVEVNDKHPAIEEFKERYPSVIFKNNKIDAKIIAENDLFDAVAGVNDEIIKVVYDPSKIVFNLEPWGQLSAKEVMLAALDIIDSMLQELGEKIERR